MRGLDFLREARGKVGGSLRVRSKRDWWVRVTRNGGKSASRCSRVIKVDDKEPVITLQEDLYILSTEVMWVGG